MQWNSKTTKLFYNVSIAKKHTYLKKEKKNREKIFPYFLVIFEPNLRVLWYNYYRGDFYNEKQVRLDL